MTSSERTLPEDRRPTRAVSIAASLALVLVWGYIRLFLFATTVFPLTYAIPLLIGVWTRDRLALWGMAVTFVIFHAIKLFWLLPPGILSDAELWANYGATFTNVMVTATAVHLIILLRQRLEGSLRDVRELLVLHPQFFGLRAQQNEELAEQAEELSRQTEELAQQGEELASQNEELQSQADEIGRLNETLGRREQLLQSLLETARLAGTERSALQQILDSAQGLFPGLTTWMAVFEKTTTGLVVKAAGGVEQQTGDHPSDEAAADAFADLVMDQDRTASLDDVSLRPDLRLAPLHGSLEARAVLCTPIRFGGETFGAFAVYCPAPHEFTAEEFRMAEWLALQCAGVLQAVRAHALLKDSDRRKGEFLATLSHELRNPLTPIVFALKLIEARTGHDDNAVRIVRRQLQQLVRLVDDLLDATRLSSNKIQIRRSRIDLSGVVQHAIEAVKPDIDAARHELSLELPDGPVWVDADADRLAQVVTNLLNNAARYTPGEGRIRIVVGASETDALVSVSDTGVGIQREDLARVFDMFTQVGGPGSGGLGIGLALVKGIVELHGGRVEARSDGEGQGSEFTVVLPLAAGAPSREALESSDPSNRLESRRVLVVDDNVDSAEMLAALLSLHGHVVHVAHDAVSALDLASDCVPDVALLDIGLPGFDGYELARRLRSDSRTSGVRLVALTGWGQDGDRARALDAGFDAHLTKPADPDLLLGSLAATESV